MQDAGVSPNRDLPSAIRQETDPVYLPAGAGAIGVFFPHT